MARSGLISALDLVRSVAFGQRAPNRATAREEGRGLGAGMKGVLGHGRPDDRCSFYPSTDLSVSDSTSFVPNEPSLQNKTIWGCAHCCFMEAWSKGCGHNFASVLMD